MDNNKIDVQQNAITQTQMQLMEMGFDLQDIQRVMKSTNEKNKVVEILLGKKQLNTEKIEEKTNKNDNKMKDQNEQDDDGFQSVQQQYKMVFLARMDLKLPLGKMAAQVATATLGAYKQIQQNADKDEMCQIAYYEWLQSGQKKIVVKVNSQQQLLKLVETIKKQKINVFLAMSTKDDELQIPQGTITIAAVGPAPEELVDKLTRHLKLF